MDLASYERILNGTRKHYDSMKPVFAYRISPTYMGGQERIILPDLDGNFPVNPRDQNFEFLTAREWDDRYYSWTLDVGNKRCIVQGRGRVRSETVHQKMLVSY